MKEFLKDIWEIMHDPYVNIHAGILVIILMAIIYVLNGGW